MRETNLKSPGILAMGFSLRRTAAQAISAIEISVRNVTPKTTRKANALYDFFTDCANKVAAYRDLTGPTVVSRVRTAPNTVVVTFNEALNPANVPAASAFVFAPARTVSAVAVSGNTVTLTAAGAVAGDTLAYTQPGTVNTRLQDLVGNQVASWTAAAVA